MITAILIALITGIALFTGFKEIIGLAFLTSVVTIFVEICFAIYYKVVELLISNSDVDIELDARLQEELEILKRKGKL